MMSFHSCVDFWPVVIWPGMPADGASVRGVQTENWDGAEGCGLQPLPAIAETDQLYVPFARLTAVDVAFVVIVCGGPPPLIVTTYCVALSTAVHDSVTGEV